MAPKKTRNILVTIRPRGGINDVEVGMFEHWVGTQSALLDKHCVVLEKAGDSRHLHAVLVWKKDTTGQNVKSKVQTIYALLIASDFRWENPKIAIDSRSHHDPDGCVGGYLSKEEHTVKSCIGFKTEELAAGKERRDAALEKKKKHVPNKNNLIPMLCDYHKLWKEDESYPTDPEQQLDFCMDQILVSGYVNYLLIWTPTLRRTLISKWRVINPV